MKSLKAISVSSALFHRLSQTNLEGIKILELVCDLCGG